MKTTSIRQLCAARGPSREIASWNLGPIAHFSCPFSWYYEELHGPIPLLLNTVNVNAQPVSFLQQYFWRSEQNITQMLPIFSDTQIVVGLLSHPVEGPGLCQQLSISPDGQIQDKLTRLQSPPAYQSSASRVVVLRSFEFPWKTRMVMLCDAAGQLAQMSVAASVMHSNTLILMRYRGTERDTTHYTTLQQQLPLILFFFLQTLLSHFLPSN